MENLKPKKLVKNGLYFLIFIGSCAFASLTMRKQFFSSSFSSQPAPATIINDNRSIFQNPKKQDIIDNINKFQNNSVDSKSLMELLYYFSKEYQLRSFVNAINQAQVESNFSQKSNQLQLETNNKAVKITDSNSNCLPNKKIDNYNFLVGIGSTMELNNSSIIVNTKQNLNEKILEILKSDLTTQEAIQINNEILNFCVEVINQMKSLLQPAMEKYRLVEITFTDFEQVRRSEKRSGITMIAETGRNVILNRERLELLFENSQTHNDYFSFQKIIDALQNLHYSLINFTDSPTGQMNFKNSLQETLRDLETVNFQITPVALPKTITTYKITKEISPLNLQLYTKPVFGVNGAVSFNFQNKDLAVGLGKAFFLPYKNSNLGFLTGADFSVNFNSQNNKIFIYNGLNAKIFIGVAYQI